MSPAQHEEYAGKEVILRDSMIKALPAERFEDDPSLLTIDVVSFGYLRIGGSLSSEAIIVMTHNGVPPSVFLGFAARGLDELQTAFLPVAGNGESEDDVLPRLAKSCFHQGGVGAERKKGEYIARGFSTKVAGLTLDHQKRQDTEGEAGDGDAPGVIDASEQYAVDPVSGQPGSIAERYVCRE